MKFKGDELKFYNACLTELMNRHGEAEYYLPTLERYVYASFQANKIAAELMNEEVVTNHTNKAKKTNKVSSPKARMFALFNKEAISLSKELGLNLVAKKSGRKSKSSKREDLTAPMRIAK